MTDRNTYLIQEIIEKSSVGTLSSHEVKKRVVQATSLLSHHSIGQEKVLQAIGRDIFDLKRFLPCPTMYYRDYVGIHQKRLESIGPCVQYMIQIACKEVDVSHTIDGFIGIGNMGYLDMSRFDEYIEKVLQLDPYSWFDFRYFIELLGRHDEVESLSPFGDIATHIKEALSPQCKSILKMVEYSVERVLTRITPSIEILHRPLFDAVLRKSFGRFLPDELSLIKNRVCTQDWQQEYLWTDAREKITIEAQLMSYIDKIDGCMMAFHEVCAGNAKALEPLKNYIQIFKEISTGKRLPLMQRFFAISFEAYREHIEGIHEGMPEQIEWFLQFWQLFDIQGILSIESRMEELAKTGKPHSKENLYSKDFGIPPYLAWKRGFLRSVSLPMFPSEKYKVGKMRMSFEEHLCTQVEK